MSRSTVLWSATVEVPHHHEVRLLPNYPARPELDAGHLLLEARQRTTGGGVCLRLGRSELVALWRFLLNPRVPLVRALVSASHADVLTAWERPDGAVGLGLSHRADESWGRTLLVGLDEVQAAALRGALGGWLEAEGRPRRAVVDVHLPS